MLLKPHKILLALSIVTTVIFSACTSEKNSALMSTSYTADQIARAIISAQDETPALHSLRPEEDYFSHYVQEIYQIEPELISDGAIFYADGVVADEIAVLILADPTETKDVSEILQKYRERRTGAFQGYAPLEEAKLMNALVISQGNYIALLIVNEPQKAEAIFRKCFSDDLPPIHDINLILVSEKDQASEAGAESERSDAFENSTITDPSEAENPEDADFDDEDDDYDPIAILAAWQTGDPAGLSAKNRSILTACQEIIAQVIKVDMGDYEMELAIHDWIIGWGSYDLETLNHSPDAKPSPDNDNPYGMLTYGKGICSGFTLTFQLFMDMLGIECITVWGKATHDMEGQHAWNMVRIDGEWYCVDVTWNAPAGMELTEENKHKFFNVSSDFMWDTGHRWDRETVPEATAPKRYQ